MSKWEQSSRYVEQLSAILRPACDIVAKYKEQLVAPEPPARPKGKHGKPKFIKATKEWQAALKDHDAIWSPWSVGRPNGGHGSTIYSAAFRFFYGWNRPDADWEVPEYTEGVPCGYIQYNGCCADGGEFNLLTAYEDLSWIEWEGKKVPPYGALVVQKIIEPLSNKDWCSILEACHAGMEYCNQELLMKLK